MLNRVLAILALAGIISLLPTGSAQVAERGEFGDCIYPITLANVAAIINSGPVSYCVHYDANKPTSYGDGGTPGQMNVRITANVVGPSAPVILTFTWTASGFTASSGCTIATTQTDTISAAGSMSYLDGTITINGGYKTCRGAIRVVITAGLAATTVYNQMLPVNIDINPNYQLTYLCAATGSNPNQFDLATTCSTPTQNVVNSGSQNIAVSGSMTNTLTGSVNSPDVAASITDLTDNLCRPTGNHGHCSLDIHGGLDLAQDGPWIVDIADDTTDDGELTTTASNLAIGNQSVVFPMELNATINGGATPVQVGSATTDFLLPVLFWGVMLLVFLRFRKLFSAGAATLGAIAALFGLDFTWHVAALALVGIALWLEALGKDKIVQEFIQDKRTQWDT